jgi:hypothetical protein
MSFGDENNIKDTVKQFIIKNKDYIINKLEKEWNNPQTIEKIKEEFITLVSKDILDSYEKSINSKNEKIKKIENEIKKFYDDLTTQIAAERSIYGDKVMESIKKYFDLLQKEEAEFNSFKSQLEGLNEKINFIKKLLEENSWQINDNLKQIKDIEKRYKDRINYLTWKLKDNFNEFSQKKKAELLEKLKKAYEHYLLELKKAIEKTNKELLKDYEIRKKEIEKHLDKAFSAEKFKIKKEKKELLKELLYFDWYTFLKVLLILWFVLLIIWLDYSLMRDIIAQYFELDPYSDSQFKLFLYQYIVPFIFSWWIILSEIINDKVVKYHSKVTYWVLKLLAYLAIIWVIASVVLTADWINFEITQLPEIVIRLILFGMSIPAAVILVDRFITLHDVLDFIKMTLLLPVRLALVPFVYIMYLFENRKIKKNKEETISNLKTASLSVNGNIKIEPIKLNIDMFISELEKEANIDYQPLLSAELENNLNNILHTLNQINSIIIDLNVISTKWTEIIKDKLKFIMDILNQIDEQLEKKISSFEKQYKPYIEDLKKQIREIEKDLEKDEEKYRNLKQDINNWVLEWLAEVI